MPSLLRASTLFALSLSPLAVAQDTLTTAGVPSGVLKVVTYDQGSFWSGAYARKVDSNGASTVFAVGNPWLGGGYRYLTSDVNDMARLDAAHPGDAEAVAMVGSAGLTLVRWDPVAQGFGITTVDAGALAQNARLVSTSPFGQNHLLAIVTADGNGVRCYRATGVFLAAPPVTGPVLDLAALRNAAGAGRLLVRYADCTKCIDLAGTVQLSVSGSGGVFVRWPQSSSTVRAGWIHHVTTDSDWRLTLLGDSEQIGSDVNLTAAIGAGEEVIAAFAGDIDHDPAGTIDLVLRTSQGTSVLINTDGNFASFHEEQPTVSTPPPPPPAPPCVPDLLTTHAGRRFRLVDGLPAGGIAWNRVIPYSQGTGEDESISLLQDAGFGGRLDTSITDLTDISFDLALTGIDPFVANGTRTQVQVVSWRQRVSTDQGRVDTVSERNVMFDLQGVAFGSSNWMVIAELEQHWSTFTLGNSSSISWEAGNDTLYWLTIRLCNTPMDSLAPNSVSEPITLVTSMSVNQAPGWTYIDGYCDLDLWHLGVGGTGGIGIISVIQRSSDPPPPPPGGIPTPKDAVQKIATHL
jgi:hypothetical protein